MRVSSVVEHREIGYNYRLSNLLAAVGRGQLATLAERIARRREINAACRKGLGDIEGLAFMPEAAYGRSNCWLTCLTLEPEMFRADRESLRRHLEEGNIESRPLWKPMHLQPVFQGCSVRGGSVSADLRTRLIFATVFAGTGVELGFDAPASSDGGRRRLLGDLLKTPTSLAGAALGRCCPDIYETVVAWTR